MLSHQYQNIHEIHLLALDLVNIMFEVSRLICNLEESRNKEFYYINSWSKSFVDQCCQLQDSYELYNSKLKEWEPVFASIYFAPVETGRSLETSWHTHAASSAFEYLRDLKSGAELPIYDSHKELYEAVNVECRKWYFGEYNYFGEILPTRNESRESELILQIKVEYNEILTLLSLNYELDAINLCEEEIYKSIKAKAVYHFLMEQVHSSTIQESSQSSSSEVDPINSQEQLQGNSDCREQSDPGFIEDTDQVNRPEEPENDDNSKKVHDNSELESKIKLPQNPDVLEICRQLSRLKNQKRSQISKVRDFLKDTYSDPDELEKRARSLLRQTQRFPHLRS